MHFVICVSCHSIVPDPRVSSYQASESSATYFARRSSKHVSWRKTSQRLRLRGLAVEKIRYFEDRTNRPAIVDVKPDQTWNMRFYFGS
jgi:hypothetical protein